MSNEKLNDVTSKICGIKMSYNFENIIMSFTNLICVIMSFQIKRLNITHVIS